MELEENQLPNDSGNPIDKTPSPIIQQQIHQPGNIISPNQQPQVPLQGGIGSLTSVPPQATPVVSTFTFDHTDPAQLVSKSHHRLGIAAISLAVVALLIAASASYWFLIRKTPTSIFNKTLGSALSTKQFTQTITGSGVSFIIKSDTTKLSSSVVSLSGSISIFGINITTSSYSDPSNSYIYFSDGASSNLTPSFFNKWIQVKSNHELPAGSTANAPAGVIDPLYDLLGQWIIGNFNSTQKHQLLNYVKTNNIYSFSSKNVKSGTALGQKVLIYKVNLNIPKLIIYNKMVAALIGASDPAELSSLASDLSSGPTSATLYISPSSYRLLRVVAVSDGTQSEVDYTNYNSTTVEQAPTPQLTYTQYLNDTSGSNGTSALF